jgi:hypothetical protein
VQVIKLFISFDEYLVELFEQIFFSVVAWSINFIKILCMKPSIYLTPASNGS